MSCSRIVIRNTVSVCVLTCLQLLHVSSAEWLKQHKPMKRSSYLPDPEELQADEIIPEDPYFSQFHGNSTHTDHFKLLKEDGTSVLVGARNIIYNLSLPDLAEFPKERIHWSCARLDKTNCDLKGKSETDCQNYIRVLSVIQNDRLLVCGTNCYNPMCRHYLHVNGSYRVETEFSGKGYAPYDPTHNSTSIFTNGHLYSATVADFSGTDPLIIKNGLRTEQYDYKHLNAPNFVSSIEDKEHVYFFFREAAVEYMNCGKSIYSRVARVCKNDEGGTHKFSNRWTTFLKSRINCSLPGEYPFYFNEIQSTTNFFPDSQDNEVLYGVFTTPQNSILGSAICRISKNDVAISFESDFKNQEFVNSNWLPLRHSQVPEPRPGRCYNQTTKLPESSLHFIKNHCLVDKAVPSRPSSPLFVKYGDNEMFTKIALHRHVRDLNGDKFDIIFVGTNRGKVMRILVEADNPDIDTSALQEEIQIFDHTVPVLNLLIVAPEGPETRLIALSTDSVKSIPVHMCHKIETCAACTIVSKPYCAWDTLNGECVAHSSVSDKEYLIQDATVCPPPPTIETTTPISIETTTFMTFEEEVTTTFEEVNFEYENQNMSIPFTILQSTSTSTELPLTTTACPTCQCNCPTGTTLPVPEKKLIEFDIETELLGADYNLIEDPIAAPSIQREIFQSSTEYDVIGESTDVLKEANEESLTVNKVILIILATSLASLIVGFLCGFFMNRVCSIKSSASVTSSNVSLMKPSPLDRPTNADSGYTTPTNTDNNNTNKNFNMIMNLPMKKPKPERAKMTCTGTLQKVKRVYL